MTSAGSSPEEHALQFPASKPPLPASSPEGIDLEALPPLAKDRAFLGMTVTQFLGAFNDNVFKQLVLLICTDYAIRSGASGDWYQSIAQAVFAAPFVAFSGLGGFLADRFEKQRIILLCKVAEIVVMALGMVVFFSFAIGSMSLLVALMFVLFLMGMQSAIFGPSKYGILPVMLRGRDLPPANGLIQMTTFLAIIFGTGVSGAAKDELENSLWIVSAICVGIAIVGTLTATLLRRVPRSGEPLPFTRGSLLIRGDTWKMLRDDRLLFRTMLLTSVFWLVAGVVLPAVNQLGKLQFGLDDTKTGLLAAAMGIGIAIGCVAAGLLSKNRVRFGIVRGGGFGIAVSLMLLYLFNQGVNFPMGELNAAELASRSVQYWGSFTLLLCLGISTGFFAVPLQVFMQARPPAGQKGRMIASMNICNWIGILLASGLYFVLSVILSKWFGESTWPAATFIVLALMMLPIPILFRPRDEPL